MTSDEVGSDVVAYFSEIDEPMWSWAAPLAPRPAGLNSIELGPALVFVDRLSSDVVGVEVDCTFQAEWQEPDLELVTLLVGDRDPRRKAESDPLEIDVRIARLLPLLAALDDSAHLLRRTAAGYPPSRTSVTSIERHVVWPGALGGSIAAHALQSINCWNELLTLIGDWPRLVEADAKASIEWSVSYVEGHPEDTAMSEPDDVLDGRPAGGLTSWCDQAWADGVGSTLRPFAKRLVTSLRTPVNQWWSPLTQRMPYRGTWADSLLGKQERATTVEPIEAGSRTPSVDHMLAATMFGWAALLIASSDRSAFDDVSRARRLWSCSSHHWGLAGRPEEAAIAATFAVDPRWDESSSGDGPPQLGIDLRWPHVARGLEPQEKPSILLFLNLSTDLSPA